MQNVSSVGCLERGLGLETVFVCLVSAETVSDSTLLYTLHSIVKIEVYYETITETKRSITRRILLHGPLFEKKRIHYCL